MMQELTDLLTYLLIYLHTYLLSYLVTYSFSRSLTHPHILWSRVFLENWFLANEEISCILWNPKVHYCVSSACHLSLSRTQSSQSVLPIQLPEDPS